MFTLCFVASCYVLCFELHFLIHLAPLMHYSSYSFLHLLPSFLLNPFVYSCQKGGEYTLECIPESFVISIWLLCTFSCTFVGGEILSCTPVEPPLIKFLVHFLVHMWVSFVQLFPTHMLSLEFVLEFCHKIAKGGDCKVEFNQPFYWLYSMSNLLVI